MLTVRDGYDEALLLDVNGYVAEGSGENILAVANGELHTPTLLSALDGITWRTTFTLTTGLGIKIVERRMIRDEFYVVDEAFFTGTAAEVIPIREIDRRAIGNGSRWVDDREIAVLAF